MGGIKLTIRELTYKTWTLYVQGFPQPCLAFRRRSSWYRCAGSANWLQMPCMNASRHGNLLLLALVHRAKLSQ